MQNQLAKTSAQSIALERFVLVNKIQELFSQGIPLAAALEQVACCPVPQPDGTKRLYAARTIEDWYYAYLQGGLDALLPKTRSDKGLSRRLTKQQADWILQQVQANPGLPVKVLYRHWRQQNHQLCSLPSIYRLLRYNQLDAKTRRQQAHQPLSGPTKCFEAPAVNDLWMVDFSPGPFLHPPNSQRAIPTHLCMTIDDNSRLVPFGAYYPKADTQSFLATLKEATQRRGLPRRLYTDHGGPFINDHVRIVCARLGIQLIHAKPYHCWSKGKIERIFRTVQEDFEASLRLPGQAVFSLQELNSKFSVWLQTVYHQRKHSSTNMTPAERYDRSAHLVRTLDPNIDLDRLFYTELIRTVRKDGTIRLNNRLYEVDLALRTLKVTLRFDPFKLDRIEVYHRGVSFGLAKPLDPHLNSQLFNTPKK